MLDCWIWSRREKPRRLRENSQTRFWFKPPHQAAQTRHSMLFSLIISLQDRPCTFHRALLRIQKQNPYLSVCSRSEAAVFLLCFSIYTRTASSTVTSNRRTCCTLTCRWTLRWRSVNHVNTTSSLDSARSLALSVFLPRVPSTFIPCTSSSAV